MYILIQIMYPTCTAGHVCLYNNCMLNNALSQWSMASNCQQVQCKLIAIIDVRLGCKGGGGGGGGMTSVRD